MARSAANMPDKEEVQEPLLGDSREVKSKSSGLSRTLFVGTMLVSALLLVLAPLSWSACAAEPQSHVGPSVLLSTLAFTDSSHSGDITSCSGYKVDNVESTASGGIFASLSQAGQACNAFGNDIADLVLSVEYESKSRLHVHIYDKAKEQFQLPDSVFARPGGQSFEGESDLCFNYTSSPFEFWISRKGTDDVLFDTRQEKIPKRTDSVDIEGKKSNTTILPGYPLVFEDQYLQIASALPSGANIYGLGEVLASSGFRRNESATVQTMWARDVGDPIDENMYGSHAVYMEARYDEQAKKTNAHGVFLLNSHGMDIVLRDGVIEYRAIGGTLDFYFVSGPTPNNVIEQYTDITGKPQVMPFWAFGFHLCRWGYTSVAETRGIVQSMRDAGIPLEVQWNDIDWMRAYREFQFDDNYSPAEYGAFVDELHSNNQYYIPIIDAAVGYLYNDTDVFDTYTRGHELDVWMKNPDGSEYIGHVWPGWTVFPDWFHPSMQQVWDEAFTNLSQVIKFDGIWLDMNEPSSFADGSAENSTHKLSPEQLQNTSTPFALPGSPGSLVTAYPEGYNSTISGTSGNITVNGSLTYGAGAKTYEPPTRRDMLKRQMGSSYPQVPEVDEPPYAIRNGAGRLSMSTVSPNATHYGGLQEYNVHNVWGTMEEQATSASLLKITPGKRPFIVGRSTFAGAGRVTAHWLGDNGSTWDYMLRSIQGVLQFGLFGIPMTGPDTCGFNGNTDEELCNRWMQLSAFYPFYRNHNTKTALSQEPFRWDSVAAASITAINARYQMLPYWLTLFAEAGQSGTPPVRALFYEFDDPSLFNISTQFMVGESILVTPVLAPNVSSVKGHFPTTNGVSWRNFFTHEKVDTSGGDVVTVDAPLGSIPVHVRSGSVLLLHAKAEYTLTETRQGPYALLVSLDNAGVANGVAKIDDGVSLPVGDQTCLTFAATSGCLSSSPSGHFHIDQQLATITLLGVTAKPEQVTLNGQDVGSMSYNSDKQELVIEGLDGDLNAGWELKWK